jgi:alkylation response protein AidB-like acyl-CoA dehydrogenase
LDFKFTEEQENLRKEVRDFLEKELPRDKYPVEEDQWIKGFSPEFSRKLGERGWIGMTWPKKYGGQERSPLDRLIVTEELLHYGAPCAAHWMGDRQMGPAIIAYGTEEQKQKYLPGIVRGEIFFAAGMSEPEAGSDLANVQTRAVETDDGFIINGQKVWTSGSHFAHYVYAVIRTDPNATPKHRGISEFIIDLKTPGITINPLISIDGHHHYNEVFFDDVHVPKDTLIGQKNRGFYQIMSQVDYERSGLERLMTNYPLFEDIKKYVRENGLGKEPSIRQKLSQLEIEFEIGRLLIYRVAWLLSQGKIPNYEAAMSKSYATAFEQRLANAATQILGLYGQLMPASKNAILRGRASIDYLFSAGYTLQGGTSEILKNIVATRGLGLPAR